ncbi:HET domain-containing protein [Fusarium keratoplasticum]|nr:HET domain-containing protein [Fusarium keratoplasticum]
MWISTQPNPTHPSFGFGPRCIYQDITSEFTVTTQDNLKAHLERGIELKDLPRTFQDAVEVARGLQVRYLWIDALCIIQNEDNHEDWKRECGNMASIYRNSYVTIAAAWANSANGGCFTTPDPGVAIGPIIMRKVSHFPYLATLEASTDFPILTRAWAYQERLLAPR